MLQAALELETHYSYVSYLASTAHCYKFKQLLWNGTAPLPHWLPAAQGNFTAPRTSANFDSEDSEERTEIPHTARATSSSSTAENSTVTQALAQALLLFTKKN